MQESPAASYRAASSRIVKQLLLYTLMLTISVGILTIAELGLRWAFPDKLAPSTDYETLRAHPIYGYSLQPDIKALFVRSEDNGGQRITWSTNADGYRGEPLQNKPDFRVVVYGDSNIQAVFSRLEDTFSKQLEARLSNSLGVNVEVINGGVVGYGPDHYLLRFIEEQPRLKADLVIFNIFADNDFGDLLRHRHFEARDDALARRNDFFVYPETTWPERLQRFSSGLLITKVAAKVLRTIVPSLERTQEPPTPARTDSDQTENYVQELRKLATDALDAYVKHAPSYVRVDTYDIDVAVDPDSETARTKVALMRLILKEAKQRAIDLDVPFLVMIQPSQVDTTTIADLNYQYLGRYPKYRAGRLVQTVEGLCRDLGIDVISLFPSFLLHEPDQLYFKDTDNHWNDRGQAVAADVVAQRVMLLHLDLKR